MREDQCQVDVETVVEDAVVARQLIVLAVVALCVRLLVLSVALRD